MNERLTIQDLIDLLAAKHSMTKKDAEAFVKEFFLLIEQALENEKTVKIFRRCKRLPGTARPKPGLPNAHSKRQKEPSTQPNVQRTLPVPGCVHLWRPCTAY